MAVAASTRALAIVPTATRRSIHGSGPWQSAGRHHALARSRAGGRKVVMAAKTNRRRSLRKVRVTVESCVCICVEVSVTVCLSVCVCARAHADARERMGCRWKPAYTRARTHTYTPTHTHPHAHKIVTRGATGAAVLARGAWAHATSDLAVSLDIALPSAPASTAGPLGGTHIRTHSTHPRARARARTRSHTRVCSHP